MIRHQGNHSKLSFQAYAIVVLYRLIVTIPLLEYAPIWLVEYLIHALMLAFLSYCWDVVYSVYNDFKKEGNNSKLPMKITCSF